MDPLLNHTLTYLPIYFPKIRYENDHDEQLDDVSEDKSKYLSDHELVDGLYTKDKGITNEQNEVLTISNIKEECIPHEKRLSTLSSTYGGNQLSPLSITHEQKQLISLSSTHEQKEDIEIKLDYFNEAKTEVTYSLTQTLTLDKQKRDGDKPVSYEFYYPFLNKGKDVNYQNNNKYPEIMKLSLSYFNTKPDLSKINLIYPKENSISSSNSIKDSEEEAEYPGLIFNNNINENHMKKEDNLFNIQQENKSDIYNIFERSVEHSPRSANNEEFLVFQQSQDIDLNLNSALELANSSKTQSNKNSCSILERNFESNKNSLAKTINLNDIFDNNIEDNNQLDTNSPRLSFHLPKIPTEPFRPFDSPANSTTLLKSDESIKQSSIKYAPHLMEDIKFHPISEGNKRDIDSNVDSKHLEHNNFTRLQSIKYKFLRGFKKIKLPKHKQVHVEELDAIH